jgi:hypothetical protein
MYIKCGLLPADAAALARPMSIIFIHATTMKLANKNIVLTLPPPGTHGAPRAPARAAAGQRARPS